MEAVESDELLRRVRNGEVTVLDVRPPEEYRAGHIPGALSIPLGELKARLKELPKDREVVAYCRGPYCVMAVEAVELLRKKGFAAHRHGARRRRLACPRLARRGRARRRAFVSFKGARLGHAPEQFPRERVLVGSVPLRGTQACMQLAAQGT